MPKELRTLSHAGRTASYGSGRLRLQDPLGIVVVTGRHEQGGVRGERRLRQHLQPMIQHRWRGNRMAQRARYIVNGYAQVWPRSVFDIKAAGRLAQDVREALGDPGVYVLYREDQPYYVGKTSGALFDRIWNHANQPADRYYNFWNFFSVFAVMGRKHRDEVEGILIAAMPTSNSASPRFRRIALPARVGTLLKRRREISEDVFAAGRPNAKE